VAAQYHVSGPAAQWSPRPGAYFRENAAALHSDLARRQSYARDFTLRFVERANYLSPKMTTRSQLRVFRFVDYESTTISKKALCQLQDREAQERGARDLQEPAP